MMEKRNFTIINCAVLSVGLVFAVRSISGRFLPYAISSNLLFTSLCSLLAYAAGTLVLWLMLRGLPGAPYQIKSKLPGGSFLAYFSISRGLGFVVTFVGLILSVILLFVINGPENIIEYIYQSNPLGQFGSANLWVNVFFVCVVAPVVEELMFRRLLLDALRPFGDKIAILYSGIAFGLLHMNIMQIFFATAIGLIIGYLMLRTNNIWYCIGLHFAINFSSILLSIVREIPDAFIAQLSTVGLLILILLTCVTGIVLFFVFLKKIRLARAPFRFSAPVNAKLIVGNVPSIFYIVLCLGVSVYALYLG